MDEAKVREYAEKHAQAVVAGDMAHVTGDIVADALPKLGGIAPQMPNPVKEAKVESVDMAGVEATVRIRYQGEDKAATVQSQWAERDGRPKIIDATIV